MTHPRCAGSGSDPVRLGQVAWTLHRRHDRARADSHLRHPARNDRLPETGELVAAQAAVARTIPLRMAMDSTGFIAFRDERKAPVCYDEPALTFGRIPERPTQQAVIPVGPFSAGRIQPAIPDALRFPRRVGPVSRVEPYLSQPCIRYGGCRHLFQALPRRPGNVFIAPASPRASSSCRCPAFRRSAVICRRACGRQRRCPLVAGFSPATVHAHSRRGSTAFLRRAAVSRRPHPVHQL